MSDNKNGSETGAVKSISRARKPSYAVSWDERGRPIFGSKTKVIPPKKEKGEQPKSKIVPTLPEHAVYLASLGHQPMNIPGTPERRKMLQSFLDVHYGTTEQQSRWQLELLVTS